MITFNRNNPEGTTGFAFENVGADSLKAAIWDALELYRCDSIPAPAVLAVSACWSTVKC